MYPSHPLLHSGTDQHTPLKPKCMLPLTAQENNGLRTAPKQPSPVANVVKSCQLDLKYPGKRSVNRYR